MNAPWLNEGVTILSRGHNCPPGMTGGSGGLPSVHGQPDFPAGGRGKSSIVGMIVPARRPPVPGRRDRIVKEHRVLV
jgi:hypothetical protein